MCLVISFASLLHTMHQIEAPAIIAAQSDYVLPRRGGRKLEV
ncbi:hypothetical protein [Thioclava sp.]